MLSSYGWGDDQMSCLVSLWNRESGWSYTATNASSGAYGIPQALPASKMASAGSDWQTNPATQIKWGLGYIKQRYGSPSAAYAAWQGRSPHWYATGGRLGRPVDYAGAFARGGSFVTRRGRGAMYVAGEGAEQERVTVTPHRPRRRPAHGGPSTGDGGAGGGVTVQVTVNMGDVSVRSTDDIDKIAAAVGKQVGAKLLAALEGHGSARLAE